MANSASNEAELRDVSDSCGTGTVAVKYRRIPKRGILGRLAKGQRCAHPRPLFFSAFADFLLNLFHFTDLAVSLKLAFVPKCLALFQMFPLYLLIKGCILLI